MQILNPLDAPLISIVGCLHGDEIFGKMIIDTFSHDSAWLPYVQFIFANEEAYHAKTRYLDQDANRSFADVAQRNHEQQLAQNILAAVRHSRFVLDIHTTTAKIGGMIPIVAHLDTDTKRVLNLCQTPNIAWVQPELACKSLIGNVPAGVSLEFEEDYAKHQTALEEVAAIVTGLITNTVQPPKQRSVYCITRPVDAGLIMPAGTKNFVFSEVLQGYPCLYGEKAYPNGLFAGEVKSEMI